VIQKIREDKEIAKTYVVALTGYGRDADRKRALEAGFNLHLTKPIDWATLTTALGKADTRGRQTPDAVSA
jgi:CheY-like chemotaxis protein